MAIPKKVLERLTSTLKIFQGVLEQQKARDVSEADTVTVIKDIMNAVFGYDKYAELTSEHAIRGTFCDLAVRIDGKLAFLLEVKAIGLDLKDSHIKQSVDYAANQGCEWVVLTNGIEWRLYKISFKKPIDKQEIATFNLLTSSAKNEDDLEKIFLLTKEGFTKSALADYCDKKDATSRYMFAALITNSDAVKSAIRREVRRVADVIIDEDTIEKILRDDVIKRETLEGPEADSAAKRVARNSDRSIVKERETEAVKADAAPTPAPAAT
ncbi:MAG: type I restriction enzyme HsdR N-terminal domain-containing protein [Phycisphaerales bacterium]